MKSPHSRSSLARAALGLAALALGVSSAFAGGLRSLNFPPVQPAPASLKVDGDLSDWSIPFTRYQPLTLDLAMPGAPQINAIFANAPAAEIAMSYNTEALYVAVRFEGASAGGNTTPAASPERWAANGGDGLELRLLGDRKLNLVWWPAAKGPVVSGRVDQGPWQTADALGLASASKPTPNGFGIEFRIPWKHLTTSGAIPASSLQWAADLSWKSVTPERLLELPLDWRTTYTHTTRNFLTSRSKLYSSLYLSGTSQWGKLEFASAPAPAKLEKDEQGNTGVTRLTASPGSPAIDGALGDWPDLAQLQTASKLLGEDRYAAAFGVQYDRERFYFAARLTTTHPVSNPTSEASNVPGFGFRGGDCIQIRLATPKGDQASLCAWLDSSTGKAQLYADNTTGGKVRADLLSRGAQLKITPAANGYYVIEGSIPWKTLWPSVQPPQSGDTWSATFQPWWAGLEPTFTVTGHPLVLQPRGALEFSYEMPADGQVSIGVYKKTGELLRWLTQAVFRQKGANVEYWDGLDQLGQPIPAGDYVVKALHYPELNLDYKLTVGNPGTPGWITPDGTGDWLSDEGTPQGVATDGDWTFFAAPYFEKAFSVMALDSAGRKQWGAQHHSFARAAALAVSGDYLYALYSGPHATESARVYDPRRKNAIGRAYLVCMDKRTGLPAKFSRATPYLEVANWPYREEVSHLWDLRNNRGYTPATYGGQPRYASDDIGESTNALGIAAVGDRVFVSLFYDDKILELDAATGKLVREIPVAKPVGIHNVNATTLLAVSKESVVRIDLSAASPVPVPVVASGLEAPFGVTTDKKGDIYVSDWKASFQVKVFSTAGKFLRAIGKPGGRAFIGDWENDGMLVPRGIAVTDEGKLWVAEDDASPKRISVWDSRSGKFLKDYIGPTPYGGGGLFWMDAKDDTIAYVMGTRVKLDYTNKTTTTLGTVLRKKDRAQPFTPNGHTGMGLARSFLRDGFTYMVYTARDGIVLLKETDGIYTPVAAAGHLRNEGILRDGTEHRVWDSAIGSHYYPDYYPDFFRGRQTSHYSWSDVNGDGLVQAEEMRWVPYLTQGQTYVEGRQAQWDSYWGTTMAPDGTIYFGTKCKDYRAIMRLDPQGWDARGVPLLDISQARTITADHGRLSAIHGLYANSEGRVYLSNNYEFWHGFSNPYAFEAFDGEGAPLWKIAMPAGPLVTESDLAEAVVAENITGEFTVPGIGNILGTWLWHASYRPYLIASDGLFVATLLDNTMVGPKSTWGESFKFYHQSTDGKPYIINGGSAGNHILEIKGLEKGGRFEKAITLTEADVAAAAAVRQVPVAVVRPKPVMKVDWPSSGAPSARQGVSFTGRSGQTVQAALSRDEARLHLAVEVEDPTPLVNNGSNWQTLFITGDCVDLMLATDPSANPNRVAAAPGDLRLLFSLYDGKPVAVLYRPSVPGTTQATQLMAARIDDIRLLSSAKIEFARTPAGYKLTASVPLADLGLDPAAIPNLRGDVGVIFSDDTGKDRSERLYYYNRNTSMISDLTTEATLQPKEWGPVIFPLGKNLLHDGAFSGPLKNTEAGGWSVNWIRSGAEAEISESLAFSGPTSLNLFQAEPLVFTPESFHVDDYDAFKNSANGGKGGGLITVRQSVPVEPGKSYALRLHYFAEGLKREIKKPGPDRGYATFSVRIEWVGARNAKDNITGVGAAYGSSQNEWKTLHNTHTASASLPAPYVAPEGAREARIVLQLATFAPDTLPEVKVDDVEFVELSPAAQP